MFLERSTEFEAKLNFWKRILKVTNQTCCGWSIEWTDGDRRDNFVQYSRNGKLDRGENAFRAIPRELLLDFSHWTRNLPDATGLYSICKYSFKGVVVVFRSPLDTFWGHIRTQRGRLPLESCNYSEIDNFYLLVKILCLCVKILPKMVFVEFYLLLDRTRYRSTGFKINSAEGLSRRYPTDFSLISFDINE